MNNNIPIKTPEEIEIIKEGGAVLKKVLEKVGEMVRPGVSTYELDQEAERIIRSHGGCVPGFKGYRGFPATLCTSVNDEVVHGIPNPNKILQEGDIVGADCGVLYKEFYTDACRTFMVGNVDPRVEHFVQTTKRALKKAIQQVKPGNHIGDISAAIQFTIMNQGYSPVVECTGHGVGRNLHEPPEILNVGEKGTGPEIKTGMVFAIEPIANTGGREVISAEDGWTIKSADGSFSSHFEHTVVVTQNGCEVIV